MFSIFTSIMSRVTHSEPGLPMVASGPDSSDSKMDAIMEALQSISSQNKGIELKIEQQDRKAAVQVQEISERFENLGARVNKTGSSHGVPAQITWR